MWYKMQHPNLVSFYSGSFLNNSSTTTTTEPYQDCVLCFNLSTYLNVYTFLYTSLRHIGSFLLSMSEGPYSENLSLNY